ncbi:MAG: chemotaxis protein CheR [Desulfosporosinus sp. BRH_c37]|nr:MAG: chemotaxis protein CheR [Desulfosporosinus sp. BRH_c37]
MLEQSLDNLENEDLEIRLLLEGIYLKYGYDFRDYSKAHLKRRIMHRLSLSELSSISQMQHQVLYSRAFLETLLTDFSINVTEMFRDPPFYKAFRQEVVPVLKTYPFIKVWHAGCSSGEEVYSMAILLKEEGLYERTQIYATDFNVEVLEKAKHAIYPIDDIKDYTYNYQQSGGRASFADYYIARYDSVILDQTLKKKIIFADHNLVTDGVFGEMHVVICRNVLIYFNRELQKKVFKLFYESLRNGGFLGIGTKESLRFSDYMEKYDTISETLKIYQKRFEV